MDNTSLTQFFTLYFLLPFLIVGLTGSHLFFRCFKNGGFYISIEIKVGAAIIALCFLLIRLFQLTKLIFVILDRPDPRYVFANIGLHGFCLLFRTLLLFFSLARVLINSV